MVAFVKATEEAWEAERANFEHNPSEDFRSIAARLGVTDHRVRQKARQQGWQRKYEVAKLNAAAQAKADRHFVPADVPGGDVQPAAPPAPAPAPATPVQAAQEHATELRKDITVRHRNEWRVVTGLLAEAIQGQKRDVERVKMAKLTAETLKIKQEGERKAWGMDAVDSPVPGGVSELRVILEREEVRLESH